jgi:hypothetical protein
MKESDLASTDSFLFFVGMFSTAKNAGNQQKEIDAYFFPNVSEINDGSFNAKSQSKLVAFLKGEKRITTWNEPRLLARLWQTFCFLFLLAPFLYIRPLSKIHFAST